MVVDCIVRRSFLLFDASILNQAVVFSAVGSWITKCSDPLSIAANLAYSFPPCDGAPSVVRTSIFPEPVGGRAVTG